MNPLTNYGVRQERGGYTSWITRMATVEKILFTFVLLNGGVPDVETIYFVSAEQKKNCLQKFPSVLVITKDKMICSGKK